MRVEQLWRYPVKSMQGERLGTADVAVLGIAGDRQWAIVDLTTGMTLTARREPRLLWASARLVTGASVGGAAGEIGVEITLPDGEVATDDGALSAWLGRPVGLRRAGGGPGSYEIAPDFEHEDAAPWLQWDGPANTFHDSTQTQVSIGSLDDLRDWDPRRFRFNVVVAGGPARPLAGETLQIGSATLEVVKHIDRCVMTTRPQPGGIARDLTVLRTIIGEFGNELGVGAAVSTDGTMSVGDVVTAGIAGITAAP